MFLESPQHKRITRKGARIAFREKVRRLVESGKEYFFIAGNAWVKVQLLDDEFVGQFARLLIQEMIDDSRVRVIMIDVGRRDAAKNVWIVSSQEDQNRRSHLLALPGDEWQLGSEGTTLGERYVEGEEDIDGLDESIMMEAELAEYEELLDKLC